MHVQLHRQSMHCCRSLSPDRREREDEALAHRAAGIHRAYYRSWHRPTRYPTV